MKYLVTLLFFTMLVSGSLYAQKDTVYVQDYYGSGGQEGTLNNAVDSVVNAGGNLSNVVFKLKPYGLYILSGTITTPNGQVLEIDAPKPGNTQNSAPPMIAWTASTTVNKTYLFDIPGDVIMKNIWLLYASIDSAQVSCSIRVGDSSATVGGVGGRAEFDGCIFDYSEIGADGSGAIEIYATHFKGIFNNCYFRNCTDPHFRYYGRAVSYRYSSTGLHADSLWFENCTFANMGYVVMQEGAEYADNVFFNHCTFYNIVMYSLESTWWYHMYVTNSLFVNTYMYGSIPLLDTAGTNGGTITIDSISTFGFSVPFTEQQRRILFANNDYDIQSWLVNWMQNNPYSQNLHRNRHDNEIPVPQPMINKRTTVMLDSVKPDGTKLFPYMNSANLYDGLDPRFALPPLNLDSLEQYLYHKWSDNANVGWAFEPDSDVAQIWPMRENMAYSNDTLKTAAMGGFPLGDLYHWWPAEYQKWLAQRPAEENRISTWLSTGKDPGTTGVKELSSNIPAKYTLSQNYPNPFNPTTQIKYSIPKSGFVSLKVYNILGQEVSTLVSGFQKAGNYQATFDGSKLASGVYLYRLQSGTASITKKFVLMK